MENFACGFGQRDMTPPAGHPVCGYFESRYVSGVIDPLYVRAIMFDNGQKKAIVIALDVCWIHQEFCAEVREKIASLLDMDADAVLINGSHTHTGPDTDLECEYREYLKDQLVGAALDAAKDLKTARLFYGETEAKGISFIRRYKMMDGSVKTNPGDKYIDQILHPLGTPDETVRLLKVVREDADDIYMFNFNTHADTVSGEYICSDWPGFACSILEAAIPRSKAMFVLGPQGDVNHHDYFAPELGHAQPIWDPQAEKDNTAHARYMARVVAGRILTICDKAVEVEGTDITYAQKTVVLATNRPEVTEEMSKEAQKVIDSYNEWLADPGDRSRPTSVRKILAARRVLNARTLPESESFGVYALKLGDFVIATLPGEPFTELGRQIQNGAGCAKLMVLCNTNGYCGYIPTKDCFDDGGYESNTNRYLIDAPDLLVNGTLDAVKEL